MTYLKIFSSTGAPGKITAGSGPYFGQCPVCKKWYRANNPLKATCSNACRSKKSRMLAGRASNRTEAAQRAVQTKYDQRIALVCLHCDETFYRNGIQAASADYCSGACKQAAYRQRRGTI